jgi:hypothetical protein
MGKKVTCTCPEHTKHQVIVDGQQIPGYRVTQQIRWQHKITTATNCSPDYTKVRNTKTCNAHPVDVEELFDEEEDGKDNLRTSPGAHNILVLVDDSRHLTDPLLTDTN